MAIKIITNKTNERKREKEKGLGLIVSIFGFLLMNVLWELGLKIDPLYYLLSALNLPLIFGGAYLIFIKETKQNDNQNNNK